jgi:hypothetical protein
VRNPLRGVSGIALQGKEARPNSKSLDKKGFPKPKPKPKPKPNPPRLFKTVQDCILTNQDNILIQP